MSLCFDFLNGFCRFGDRCKFQHSSFWFGYTVDGKVFYQSMTYEKEKFPEIRKYLDYHSILKHRYKTHKIVGYFAGIEIQDRDFVQSGQCIELKIVAREKGQSVSREKTEVMILNEMRTKGQVYTEFSFEKIIGGFESTLMLYSGNSLSIFIAQGEDKQSSKNNVVHKAFVWLEEEERILQIVESACYIPFESEIVIVENHIEPLYFTESNEDYEDDEFCVLIQALKI